MPSTDTHGIRLQVRRHAQLGKNDVRSLNRGMKLIMRIATATSKAKRGAATRSALAAVSCQQQPARGGESHLRQWQDSGSVEGPRLLSGA